MSKSTWPVDSLTHERVPRWATNWICPVCELEAKNTECTPEACKTPLPTSPWRWSDGPRGPDGLPRWMLDSADNGTIVYADVSDPKLGPMGWSPDGVVVRDARVRTLIAIAPELRKALEWALDKLGEVGYMGWPADDFAKKDAAHALLSASQ